MLLDVRADHLKIVQEILRKFVPEREVWAFGSRAKWLAKEYSDLDLCIVGDSALSFRTLGLMQEAFEDSDLPYKVDLVDWATTSESFRKIIERDRVLVQKVELSGAVPSKSEWNEKPLGDVVELKRGYDLPKDKRSPGKVPIISSSGITDYHAESMVQGPGVVTGRYGTIGEVFFVEGDYWPLNTTLYVRDFKGNDALFVSYLLRTLDFHAYSDKGAVPGVNRNHLHMARVRVPDRVTQEAIAKVLNSLDRKITLNRRINQTLEAMAQAIFKSWFVDFDPVKAKIAAKQEGRDPLRAAMSAISGKLDTELDALPCEQYEQLATTAALFPDEMEESELGEIPKGWEVEPIGNLVKCFGGATPDTKNNEFWKPGEYAWTTPKDLSGNCSPLLLSTERKISRRGVERISSGLLPAGTVLMSSRAPIGYLAIAQMPVAINQGYIAMPPGGKLPPFYLYFWCSENMDIIKGNANGSTFLEISKKAFRPILALKPSNGVLSEFLKRIEPLFSRIIVGERENADLASLRDTLLPKLLSGELSIEEARNKVAP
jgi:type I restriction enzyme, S subunit